MHRFRAEAGAGGASATTGSPPGSWKIAAPGGRAGWARAGGGGAGSLRLRAAAIRLRPRPGRLHHRDPGRQTVERGREIPSAASAASISFSSHCAGFRSPRAVSTAAALPLVTFTPSVTRLGSATSCGPSGLIRRVDDRTDRIDRRPARLAHVVVRVRRPATAVRARVASSGLPPVQRVPVRPAGLDAAVAGPPAGSAPASAGHCAPPGSPEQPGSEPDAPSSPQQSQAQARGRNSLSRAIPSAITASDSSVRGPQSGNPLEPNSASDSLTSGNSSLGFVMSPV